MAQYDVHDFGDGYVVDCQSADLDHFNSRVVVPLLPTDVVAKKFSRLTPILTVNGDEFVMATHLIAAVDRGTLGPAVASLTADRYTIQTAIDVLTGSY